MNDYDRRYAAQQIAEDILANADYLDVVESRYIPDNATEDDMEAIYSLVTNEVSVDAGEVQP